MQISPKTHPDDDDVQRKPQDTTLPPHTSEETQYIIFTPPKADSFTVKQVTEDIVDAQGYTKRKTVPLPECGCCGRITSLNPEEHLVKPPAGRCQNADCRALLCSEHCGKVYRCIRCNRPLCEACLRRLPGTDESIVFCDEHFAEFAEPDIKKRIRECTTGERKPRHGYDKD